MGIVRRSGAGKWLLVAVGLMVFALAATYLMLFRVIPSTLFLNLFAVFSSLLGSVIGMYGTFLIYSTGRKDRMNRKKMDDMNRHL